MSDKADFQETFAFLDDVGRALRIRNNSQFTSTVLGRFFILKFQTRLERLAQTSVARLIFRKFSHSSKIRRKRYQDTEQVSVHLC